MSNKHNGGFIGSISDYGNTGKLRNISGQVGALPVFVGGSSNSYEGTTASVELPFGPLSGGVDTTIGEGDIVIINVSIATASDKTTYLTDAIESESFVILDSQYINTSYGQNSVLAYKIMGSSPLTSITLPYGSSNSNTTYSMSTLVFRGNFDASSLSSIANTVALGVDLYPTAPDLATAGFEVYADNNYIVAGFGSSGLYSITYAYSDPGVFDYFVKSGAADSYNSITTGAGYVPLTAQVISSGLGAIQFEGYPGNASYAHYYGCVCLTTTSGYYSNTDRSHGVYSRNAIFNDKI